MDAEDMLDMCVEVRTAGKNRAAFRIQASHHLVEHLHFVANGVGEEVGVDEDGVGRTQGGVVLRRV